MKKILTAVRFKADFKYPYRALSNYLASTDEQKMPDLD